MKRLASFTSSRRRESNRHRSVGIVLGFVALAFVAIVAACSNQGEGERCDVLNGNDDCKTDDGLVCYPANQLRGPPESARCCPANRAAATQPVCMLQVSPIADAATPEDTGPAATNDSGPATTDDSGSDANTADAADASDQ